MKHLIKLKLLFAFILCIVVYSVTYAQNQNCSASYTYVQDTSSYCVKFKSTSVASAGSTYSWSFGDGNYSSKKNPNHCFSSSIPTTVCLTVIDSTKGCQSTFCDSVVFGYLNGNNLDSNNTSLDSNNISLDSTNYSLDSNYTSLDSLYNNWDSTYTSLDSNNTSIDSTLNSGCQAAFSYDDSCYFHFYSNSLGVSSQTLYGWNFGDGGYSFNQNPVHTYATNGSYTVCLSILDSVSLCTSTICDSVVVTCAGIDTLFNLTGSVALTNDSLYPNLAKVYLIKYNAVKKTLKAVSKTDADFGGYYQFSNISAGDYLVKAWLKKGSPDYKKYLPTYLGDQLYWSKATTVNLTNDSYGNDIHLIAGLNPGGPGFVGGKVSKGANKTSSDDISVEDVAILVLDMNNNPVMADVTDDQGQFSLDGLAYGTYQIYTEVEGRMTTPIIVTLDANNASVSDLDIVINSGEVVAGIAELELADEVSSVGEIYPNPTSANAQIDIALKDDMVIDIIICDALGKIVSSQKSELQSGSQKLILNTASLKKGIYTVQVRSNETSIAHKQLVVLK